MVDRQYRLKLSSDNGASDQTGDLLFEESRNNNLISHSLHAEIVKEVFEDRPGCELPGCMIPARECLSENFGMELLLYPQKYNALTSHQQEESEGSLKFDYLRMCDEDSLLVKENPGKLFNKVVSDGTSEHEFIKQVASESSDIIFVDNELSVPMVSMNYSQALGACKILHVKQQEAVLQETRQFGGVLKSLHPSNDSVYESGKATCMHSIEPGSEIDVQHEEIGSKNFEDQSVSRVSDGTSVSKPRTEKHDTNGELLSLGPADEDDDTEGLSVLGSANKDLLGHEEDTSTHLQGDHYGHMERATNSLGRQEFEEPEIDESSLILEAVNKPDLVYRGEESKNSGRPPNSILKRDAKAVENEKVVEKQLESGEQCTSFRSIFNAAVQHSEELSNVGELLNMRDHNLKDGEKAEIDINNPLSCLSERGAVTLQRAYKNSNKFNIGDLVWAKVRSHPWWPAQVFDPAYASEFAKKQEQAGKVLIAFFGDRTFAWLQECQLIAFQPNFKEKANKSNNKAYCKGVVEALEEICKLSELASICQHYEGSLHCLSTFSNRQPGYGNLLCSKQCKVDRRKREEIKPAQTLEFIKSMACNPYGSCEPTIEAAELRGHAYGCRACMVAFSKADFLQNIEVAMKTHASYLQKRQYSSIELATGTGAEAEERMKKLKTTNVTENENDADVGETLLPLAHDHFKLLERGGDLRVRKDLHCHLAKEERHMETMGHVNDAEHNSGSLLSNKTSFKAATDVCGKRKRKSDLQDVFSFPPPESEENFPEAGMEILKSRKKPSGAEVPQFLKNGELPLDGSNCSEGELSTENVVNSPSLQPPCHPGMLEDTSKRKGNGISRVGYSISKIAIELASRLKCADGSSRKLTKFRSKKKGSSAKVLCSLKCNDAVPQASPLESGHLGTVQLYQILKNLARDPLNKAGMRRSSSMTQSLLLFLAEFLNRENFAQDFFENMGKPVLLSFEDATEETGYGAKNCTEDEQVLPPESLTGSSHTVKEREKIHVEEAYNEENTPWEPNKPRPFENNDPIPRGSTPMAFKCRTFNQPNSKKSSVPLHLGIFMQFPQNYTLPSDLQLETMFVRFGPVQPSGVSVFEESASAQVIFAHDRDAKAAYEHAKETAMFETASVTYRLCQYRFVGNRKETRGFPRGSSSEAYERVPSLKDERVSSCLELAASLKRRAKDQRRVVNKSLGRRPKNALANGTSSRQRPRNGNRHRSSQQLRDKLQERMMTLLRRVNVIVGSSNDTLDGQ